MGGAGGGGGGAMCVCVCVCGGGGGKIIPWMNPTLNVEHGRIFHAHIFVC